MRALYRFVKVQDGTIRRARFLKRSIRGVIVISLASQASFRRYKEIDNWGVIFERNGTFEIETFLGKLNLQFFFEFFLNCTSMLRCLFYGSSVRICILVTGNYFVITMDIELLIHYFFSVSKKKKIYHILSIFKYYYFIFLIYGCII